LVHGGDLLTAAEAQAAEQEEQDDDDEKHFHRTPLSQPSCRESAAQTRMETLAAG
jgi:hypothetical protein